MSLAFGDHTPAPAPGHDEQPDDGTNPMIERLLTRSQLRDLPRPTPLIDGIINRGNTAVVVGNPGSGKSFLILDWLACLATGKNWQGKPTHLEDDKTVLYIAAEGQGTIDARLDAWERGYQQTIPDTFIMYPDGPNLMSAGAVDQTADLVEHIGADVVCIDTMAWVMGDGDENSARDVSTFVRNVEQIRRAMGDDGTLIIVHHNNKMGVMRGSTALLGAVDVAYNVSNDNGLITMRCEKKKDGPDPGITRLTLSAAGESAVLGAYHENTDVFVNPLVAEMETIRALLPMSRAELVRNVDLPELDVSRLLARGLEEKTITQAAGKVPKYELPKS